MIGASFSSWGVILFDDEADWFNIIIYQDGREEPLDELAPSMQPISRDSISSPCSENFG